MRNLFNYDEMEGEKGLNNKLLRITFSLINTKYLNVPLNILNKTEIASMTGKLILMSRKPDNFVELSENVINNSYKSDLVREVMLDYEKLDISSHKALLAIYYFFGLISHDFMTDRIYKNSYRINIYEVINYIDPSFKDLHYLLEEISELNLGEETKELENEMRVSEKINYINLIKNVDIKEHLEDKTIEEKILISTDLIIEEYKKNPNFYTKDFLKDYCKNNLELAIVKENKEFTDLLKDIIEKIEENYYL